MITFRRKHCSRVSGLTRSGSTRSRSTRMPTLWRARRTCGDARVTELHPVPIRLSRTRLHCRGPTPWVGRTVFVWSAWARPAASCLFLVATSPFVRAATGASSSAPSVAVWSEAPFVHTSLDFVLITMMFFYTYSEVYFGLVSFIRLCNLLFGIIQHCSLHAHFLAFNLVFGKETYIAVLYKFTWFETNVLI